MLHEALMLEIYRQALNAGALPNPRPRSTESANSSERCPSHESNSSENGGAGAAVPSSATFQTMPQTLQQQQQQQQQQHNHLQQQPPSMEAYLHMVAAAAQKYGFPLGAASMTGAPNMAGSNRVSMPLPSSEVSHFKLPPQASPTTSSSISEALDFRTNLFNRSESTEQAPSEAEDENDNEENQVDADNPLDLSIGARRKRYTEDDQGTAQQVQIKKVFKETTAILPPGPVSVPQIMPTVNPYLAAVAAANIFRSGQFPDWNGKSDLVIDPLEKMTDIVKGPRKEKMARTSVTASSPQPASVNSNTSTSDGMSKARHNIWQSHWQNKGVASSVFRCVWCKQSFSTLDALTTHMKDSKHCGVNVPPFGNLPNADRHHHQHQQQQQQQHQQHQHQSQISHNMRKTSSGAQQMSTSASSSAASKNSYNYSGRGDPPTPLPRKLVRGQNVWLGKGVEQAMQILKCMRCGESFRSLGEMTKHMQETQHYTNILSQEQTISMKSTESKDGTGSMCSEESRTLSAVLTCKACDKAFSSLGELSNHMAKNNHYSEPLMQSMSGGVAGSRKRQAPKRREKSLPVRKLLELKGATHQNEADVIDVKLQRTFDAKRIPLEANFGANSVNEKMEATMFAERMRQYISGVKSADDQSATNKSTSVATLIKKSPEIEVKNGGIKQGSSSVLSAIEQMFTTSFDTPPRQTGVSSQSPSSSVNKNSSPVASSILKRLGIDETVDYNKPLIDTQDAYYQQYRYTSSERSGSECSTENHTEAGRRVEAPTPEKNPQEIPLETTQDIPARSFKNKTDGKTSEAPSESLSMLKNQLIKSEIKSENEDESQDPESNTKHSNVAENREEVENAPSDPSDLTNLTTVRNDNQNKATASSPKPVSQQMINVQSSSPHYVARSPESHHSETPKSPASSIKSFDGDKKYPSDSLNALSSMFDSLGSNIVSNRNSVPSSAVTGGNKNESPENLSTSNSLAALRQFCVKKEKTA